MFITHDP